MYNNKGFTLVEVLGVVVILMALIVIITPKVISSYQGSGDKVYMEQVNNLIECSKIYMSQHTELLPETDSYYEVSFDELKSANLIKNDNILNPKTKELMTGCILVSWENNKYVYEYDSGDMCNK